MATGSGKWYSRAATQRTPLAKMYSAWRGKEDRKSTRLNSSHGYISYAVFCLKKKTLLVKAIADEDTQDQANLGLESLPDYPAVARKAPQLTLDAERIKRVHVARVRRLPHHYL